MTVGDKYIAAALSFAFMLMAAAWFLSFALDRFREYAPPPNAKRISAKHLGDERWRIRVMWNGRDYALVGYQMSWEHARSGRACRSKLLRRWLCREWQALEQDRVAAAPFEQVEAVEAVDITDAEGSVIRLAGGM